jgi:hypothetical protein
MRVATIRSAVAEFGTGAAQRPPCIITVELGARRAASAATDPFSSLRAVRSAHGVARLKLWIGGYPILVIARLCRAAPGVSVRC